MNDIQDWLSIGNPDGEPFKVGRMTPNVFTFLWNIDKG